MLCLSVKYQLGSRQTRTLHTHSSSVCES